MDLKLINKLFANLENPGSYVETINRETPIRDGSEGSQGEENTYDKIYKVPGEPDLFLVVHCYTNSYGDNDAIRGAEIAKRKREEVIVYKTV